MYNFLTEIFSRFSFQFLFSPNSFINLKFISLNENFDVTVERTSTGLDLKKEIQNKCENLEIDSIKLIRVKNNSIFQDAYTIKDQNVEANEEFLYVQTRIKKRTEDRPAAIIENEDPEVSDDPIVEAPHQLVLAENFNRELRKLIITLAELSIPCLTASPCAEKLVNYFRQKIRNQLNHEKLARNVLENLGFSKEDIDKGLKLMSNNYFLVLDWLIDNATIEVPSNLSRKSSETSTHSLRVSKRSSIFSSKYKFVTNVADIVEQLKEIVKFYSQKEELPDVEQLETLVAMGFLEAEVREALKFTRNHRTAAFEWLMGFKSPDLLELRQGFSKNSIIARHFRKSVPIQEHLNDPMKFVAFMNILENEKMMDVYLVDRNENHFFRFIIQSFHFIKHAMAENQFRGSKVTVSASTNPHHIM